MGNDLIKLDLIRLSIFKSTELLNNSKPILFFWITGVTKLG